MSGGLRCRHHVQGSSPDEVALVDGARALGFEFVGQSGADYTVSIAGVRSVFQVRAASQPWWHSAWSLMSAQLECCLWRHIGLRIALAEQMPCQGVV